MQVADYCAGAGGKTLAIAAGMNNKGRVVAMDVYESRLDRSAQRLRRAGAHNVERRALMSKEGSPDNAKWLKRQKGAFDRVLVDAPCTGTGTWRRNPDGRWTLQPKDLEELVPKQAAILDAASRLVKPGGGLIYATCSVLPAENERQIEAFLQRHPEFEVVPGRGAVARGGRHRAAGPKGGNALSCGSRRCSMAPTASSPPRWSDVASPVIGGSVRVFADGGVRSIGDAHDPRRRRRRHLARRRGRRR